MLLSFLLAAEFSGCTDEGLCVLTAQTVTLRFKAPFDYSEDDYLLIDDMKFRHVYTLDSIRAGNYLPKEHVEFIKVENKKGLSKTNVISIATLLMTKLHNTGNYEILNPAQTRTSGILRFKRKDARPIRLSYPEGYGIVLNDMACY